MGWSSSAVPDLTFIPTADLTAELARRAEGGIIILEHRREKGSGGGDDLRSFKWWGGMSCALGLARMLEHDILDDRADGAEDAETEE
jgi:hypothetical protein